MGYSQGNGFGDSWAAGWGSGMYNGDSLGNGFGWGDAPILLLYEDLDSCNPVLPPIGCGDPD